MKRCIAILLILVLLLNVAGFYGILQAFRYQFEKEFLSNLDASRYDAEATQLIKIPLTVPYASNQAEYRRVDGNFDYEGNHYRLVKQRFSQDTLYVVCIQDHQAKMLNKALSDYIKTYTDDTSDGHADAKPSFSFAKDYLFQSFSFSAVSDGWSMSIRFSAGVAKLIASFAAAVLHPPQVA